MKITQHEITVPGAQYEIRFCAFCKSMHGVDIFTNQCPRTGNIVPSHLPGWFDFFWTAYNRKNGASVSTLKKRAKFRSRKGRSATRRLRFRIKVYGRTTGPMKTLQGPILARQTIFIDPFSPTPFQPE